MPRKSERARTQQIQSADKAKYREIQQLLGEESDSSFQSVSTDREATQYELEYTNRSSRDKKQSKNASISKQNPQTNLPSKPTSARKSNSSRSLLSSPEAEQQNRNGVSISPNRQSQRSGGGSVSRDSRGQNALDNSQTRRPHSQPTGSSKRKTNRPVRQEEGTSKKLRTKTVWKQIQVYQNSTGHLVPKLSFSRVIREIAMAESTFVTKFTPTALMCLQEAAETYLVQLFQDCYMCTIHRDRVTLMVKDMELVRYLRGRMDPGNL